MNEQWERDFARLFFANRRAATCLAMLVTWQMDERPDLLLVKGLD
jgi:hypothetical protein